jgi:hypothetical protein
MSLDAPGRHRFSLPGDRMALKVHAASEQA